MSDTVDRLKELLFDSEAQKLGELSRRIDAADEASGVLRERSEAERRVREEMQQRLEAVFERAGSREKLEDSVADVIEGALRKAEIDRHDQLAAAIAPLVVRTVKTEIGNSKDELVEALYPMTGRMVKAYIASAMKDLANDINRRLDSNPLMLRLRSLTTGKSMGELAMADAQRLNVEELYLIRRGTGELLARWPETSPEQAEGRDHVMSGILTAINEFSTEALGDEGGALRQIDLGERQLYLRASPVYLLAAKCSGVAPQPVEAQLDEAFLKAIEKLSAIDGRDDEPAQSRRLLPALSEDLTQRIGDEYDSLPGAGPRRNPLKVIAWGLGLVLAGWAGWSAYTSYRTEHTREVAASVVSAMPELSGYPVRLSVGYMGRSAAVAGLAPSLAVKSALADKLTRALPGVDVSETLTVLPNVLDEIEPKIARVREDLSAIDPKIAWVRENVTGLGPEIQRVRKEMATLDPKIEDVRGAMATLERSVATDRVRQSIERTGLKLERIVRELPRIESLAGDAAAKKTASDARAAAAATMAALDEVRGMLGTLSDAELIKVLEAHATRMHAASSNLSNVVGGLSGGPVAGRTQTRTDDPTAPASADTLLVETDWLSEVTMSASQVLALQRSLPAAQAPTPRERLEAWSRANAVFFANGTEYRDPDAAEQTIAGLASLMRETGLLVRVAGYTDEKGGQNPNNSLSRARAGKVMTRLVELGVPERQLVAIGRLDSRDISPVTGDTSPNRRVEFEPGFDGEGGR